LCKLAKLKKNLKNDIESGCGWLYKIPRSPKNKKKPRAENKHNIRSGVFNLFAIAGRITFIYMKYGRQ